MGWISNKIRVTEQIWRITNRGDQLARAIADRHYSRVRKGSRGFVQPGACLVMVTPNYDALWITSWPKFTQHRWRGAWINSMFRNESDYLSSDLIRWAVAATRAVMGEPPDLGMVTFIDDEAIRWKTDPGFCFKMAGFRFDGVCQSGVWALKLPVEKMPVACGPVGWQERLVLNVQLG